MPESQEDPIVEFTEVKDRKKLAAGATVELPWENGEKERYGEEPSPVNLRLHLTDETLEVVRAAGDVTFAPRFRTRPR